MPTTPLGIPTPDDSVKISALAASQRNGFNKVDQILSGGLTPQLEEAARDVAIDAVEEAADQMDYVKGSDTRVLRNTDSTDYALPVADEDGYVAGGFTHSGIFDTQLPPTIQGASGVNYQPINDSVWASVICDEDGYVATGVRKDGTVFNAMDASDPLQSADTSIGYTRSKRNRIATAGDSLTAGYFDLSPGPAEDSWPSKMAALLPAGVELTNLAMSGYTIDEGSMAIGALGIALSGTIPANGSATLATNQVIGWRELGITRSYHGTIAGIPGTLTRQDSNTSLTFTRDTSGTAHTIVGTAEFVATATTHSADTIVSMLGFNNVAFNIAGPDADVVTHVLKGTQRIYQWMTRQLKQCLFLSISTATNWTQGTAQHTTVAAINAALSATYGPKFYDLRRYLVDQAIYDLGIAPTPEDLAAMGGDSLPPSILGAGDTTHWSRATAELVAHKIYEQLTAREWIIP